jgi:serine/threonine protein kinase
MSKKNGVKNPVIIKFTQNHAMNDIEFEALTKVYEYAHLNNQKDMFANTYNKGKVFVQDGALQGDQDKLKKIQKKDLTEEQYQIKQLETQVWSYIV